MTPIFVRNGLFIAGVALALAPAVPAFAAKTTTSAPLIINIEDQNTCPGTWTTTATASGVTVTCNTTQAPPPAGAPVCTMTANTSVVPNTAVPLALNCTVADGGPITYAWNQGSPSGTLVSTSASFTTPALTSSTTYWGSATANGQVWSKAVVITVAAPAPPPTTSNCSNYRAVNIGTLAFDGLQVNSTGMVGNAVAYGRIDIPNPLPPGWLGARVTISVFQSGAAAAWRKVYLSKTACDFSTPLLGQGVSANAYMSIGQAGSGTVVMPGESWYLNVKDELPFGGSSCGSGYDCNFGLRMYPPN